jgi:hypothetical protein
MISIPRHRKKFWIRVIFKVTLSGNEQEISWMVQDDQMDWSETLSDQKIPRQISIVP